MLSPTEEEKLRQAVIRLKESADTMRKAQSAIANAVCDIRMDASICWQFCPEAKIEADKLARQSRDFSLRLNRLEVASVTIWADRLADSAWDKRPIDQPTNQPDQETK